MTLKEKLKELYNRALAEEKDYREWLLAMPPEELLIHCEEYGIRENLLYAIETVALYEHQVDCLLQSPTPLRDILRYYDYRRRNEMDFMRNTIEKLAEEIDRVDYYHRQWNKVKTSERK